jgi:MFS family permease
MNAETGVNHPASSSIQLGRSAPWLLMAAYAICFIDRQIINILAEPIKHDLNLTDAQLGLLTGLSFALFYTVLGIPVARLAERFNRSLIISMSMLIWSGFTVLCGLAGGFATLFASRMGVGIGEAGCTPSAQSMIADYTPRHKRTSTMAFYMVGAPIGGFIGMAFGGLIAAHYGWRAAFLAAGLPGIMLALTILALLPDPVRRHHRGSANAETPPLRAALGELWRCKTYRYVASAAGICAFVSAGQLAFLASFYLREHGEALNQSATILGATGVLGIALGIVVGLGQGIGILVGGRLSRRFAAAGGDHDMMICAVMCAMAVPFALAALTVSNLWCSMTLFAVSLIFGTAWNGPTFSAVSSIVHAKSRATAVAVTLFIISVVGLGLGPLSVGFVSDYLHSATNASDGLRWALMLVSLSAAIAIPAFLMAHRTIRADRRD